MGETEKQSRQVRQDVVLAQVGVGGAAGLGPGGAGVAVAAAVTGSVVNPVGFQAAAAGAAVQQAGQQVGAVRGCCPGGAAVLDGDVVGLADQGRVGGPGGDDPVGRRVPTPDVVVAEAGVGRVEQVVVGALEVPDLVAGVAGLARMARTVVSTQRVPCRCGLRSGPAAAGQGMAASLRARVMRATLCRASRWV
ncbi:hypothetical protein GCM10010365_23990 [Streptomyces poonensis]|uniref:Uncharacterized protein n=1 Tax=Streptomyces poonensis TaxID=68255 RepID=A0A918UGG0_9ACTN|nr:hypothetical protein GCM10010365_23990 [Streptomyces poonensis]GLJ89343.1 hypothetical protein GCM10017589_19430 [Streptomyces poonensis]